MTGRVAPWPRPHFRAGGGAASVEMLLLAKHELEPTGTPAQYWDWSPYDLRPAGLTSGFVTRDDAPALFTWLMTDGGARPDSPSLCPVEERATRSTWVASATHLFRVAADVPDPADLGYLQAAWAMVRWNLDAGAYAVFDAKALRWHSREDVARLYGPRPFSLRSEIQLEEHGRALNTRGMIKFGRPDLVCLMTDWTPSELDWGRYFFESLATEMAQGRRLAPGEEGRVEGIRFQLRAYEPNQNAPDLGLDDPAMLVEVSWPRDAS